MFISNVGLTTHTYILMFSLSSVSPFIYIIPLKRKILYPYTFAPMLKPLPCYEPYHGKK